MHLRVRLDGRNPRRWLPLLLDRIARLPGLTLEVERAPGPGSLPGNAGLLFRFEALLNRRPLGGLAMPAGSAALAAYAPPSAARPDLTLDLCGDVTETAGSRVWRLTFDGQAGEAGLFGALLDGHSPVAALVENGNVVASGRLGTEARNVVLTGFEDGLARATTLIVAALSGARPTLPSTTGPVTEAPHHGLSARALGERAGRALAHRVARRLHRLCFRFPHWRVGWRPLAGADLIDLRAHPPGGWRNLPDDGRRFYADPFPIEHQGRTILFVEDFEHARGKAVISAVAFGPDGPEGTPAPVLDEPHHLSYPFVFARDGAFWMVPESTQAGTVDLYRATAFPGGWVKEATLLANVVASDATLLEHEGRWWMFATLRDESGAPAYAGQGSYSDALNLWSAPDFRGPWTAHAKNPGLSDNSAARPAGRIVARDGVLIRPVQDCRLGYGERLSLARIDRLDDDGYAQTVLTTLRAGPDWAGAWLHTLNRSRDFEFIDGSGRAPRFRL